MVLGLLGLLITLLAGSSYSDIAQSLSSEPVYEADPDQVNPAYEGRLVKMRVTELRAEGGPVADAHFGLLLDNCVMLHRYYETSKGKRFNVIYRALDGVHEAVITAPTVRAGAYQLIARDSFWKDLGGEFIPPGEIQLPAAWESRIIERTTCGTTLRTFDTSNLALPSVTLCFLQVPSPWQGLRFVVGRQKGSTLDLTEKHAGEIRGEEAFHRYTRSQPAALQLLLSGPEMLLWHMGAFLLAALCLFPSILLLQKRGRKRAISLAILLELLLASLTSGAWLLAPYRSPAFMTWVYTLSPGAIATLLLCLSCRRKKEFAKASQHP